MRQRQKRFDFVYIGAMATAVRKRLVRLFNRIAISGALFVVFAAHVAESPRFEIIDRVENYLYDVRVQATMPGTIDDRIVIIDIDEASQKELGQWPWPRATLATIVDRLFDDYGIRVFGFDVLFAEAEQNPADPVLSALPEEDEETFRLRQQLESLRDSMDGNVAFSESLIARDVVTGFVFKDSVSSNEPKETGVLPAPVISLEDIEDVQVPFVEARGFTGALPDLQENAIGGGFFDSPLIDSDGVFRRAPLVQRYEGDLYPSLSLAVANVVLGQPQLGLRFASEQELTGVNLDYFVVGDRLIPIDEQAAVFIPFRGPQESFPYVSAKDIVAGTADANVLDGRIALLGASAAGLLDLRATPVGQRYIGVEAHANLVAGLLDGNIRRQPSWSDGLEIVSLFVVALLTALALPRLRPFSALLFVAGLLVLISVGNLWLWSSGMLVIPIASLLAYTLLAALLQITYGFFIESRNKRHLSTIFGQYIPPKLVEEIDSSGADVSLDGETRNMSVLFSDVRGFTTMSEGLDARELTQLMNEFLTPFTRAIQNHRGTIDKYMGDAVMAFWGAPLRDDDHARHALSSAYEMLDAVYAMDEPFKAKGWPPIRVGIGISSGEMNVGNMGSEFRIAYTVMGDTVNLGSRLEGLTKQYGVDIIVSDATAALIPEFAFRELDLVRVKGKTEPVAIYEPLGLKQELCETVSVQLSRYHEAISAYREKRWDDAVQLLTELDKNGDEKIYIIYLDRIKAFRTNPPPTDWDGVFEHLVK